MNNLRELWKKAGSSFRSVFRTILLLLVGGYRTLGTPIFGGSCRFEPSCSEYAIEALTLYSPGKASLLIGRRICKCRPGGPFGYDPVPHQRGVR